MTGDELGGSRFRRRVRGYDARQVDAWLSASEDSVDAGVSPLASNPGGRFPLAVRGYDIQAVDRLIDAFASEGASDGTPPVPAAGTSITAFREPEPSDVRGSADRDRPGAPDALSVRVRSYRWKAAAFFLILAGWPTSLAAMVAILQIDGAAADVHWTPSQDAVGWPAFGVGFTGLVAAVVDVVGFIVVGLVSEAAVAVAILCCWVTLSRTVVVGPGWLAWQPRLTRRWRILPLADVVSTIDLQWPRRQGVRLSRADGSGLRLRNPELAAGLGAAAGPQLAEHPAATAEFLTAVLGKQDEHRCGE